MHGVNAQLKHRGPCGRLVTLLNSSRMSDSW